jgi:hypothetical protein
MRSISSCSAAARRAFFDSATEPLLTEFVAKRAGSVVFARGKPYGGRFQPLAKFEPVAWGDGSAPTVRLKPTEAARDNPSFDLGASGNLEELLDRLPALDQSSVTLGEKAALHRAGHSGQSRRPGGDGLSTLRPGQGAEPERERPVALVVSEAGQEESETAYRRFWISLLQWLLSGGQFLPGPTWR